MEIVKIRMQIAGTTGKRVTALGLCRDLGLRGLYQGTPATLLRDVPFSVIFFPLQASLKQVVTAEGDKPSFGVVFWSGVVAGAVGGAAVTPADVIKTRLQASNGVYKGVVHCYQEIVRTEGYRALYRGAAWRAGIISPLFAIATVTYEVQQRYFSFG
jgi:solute carrier family 25 aspartate/glutamate transporter 12/13